MNTPSDSPRDPLSVLAVTGTWPDADAQSTRVEKNIDALSACSSSTAPSARFSTLRHAGLLPAIRDRRQVHVSNAASRPTPATPRCWGERRRGGRGLRVAPGFERIGLVENLISESTTSPI